MAVRGRRVGIGELMGLQRRRWSRRKRLRFRGVIERGRRKVGRRRRRGWVLKIIVSSSVTP